MNVIGGIIIIIIILTRVNPIVFDDSVLTFLNECVPQSNTPSLEHERNIPSRELNAKLLTLN